MLFESFNKNLNLCKVTPWTEVQSGIPIYHNGEYIRFVRHKFETEDESLIEWLKKHRLFSVEPKVVNMFWVYVPPVDLEAENRKKEARIIELERELAETKCLVDENREENKKKGIGRPKIQKDSEPDVDVFPGVGNAESII